MDIEIKPIKKIIYLIVFFFFSSILNIVNAQGYIDCATVLNDDGDAYDGGEAVHLDGYTYFYANIYYEEYDFVLPLVNGEAFHHTEDGGDGYLGIFDEDCNLIFGGFIGGDEYDEIRDIDVDDNGDVIITGHTRSTDFITTDGTSITPGNRYIFTRKYTRTGNLVFSTLIGGTQSGSEADNIFIDGTDIFVIGNTNASDFPTTDGTTPSGGVDAAVIKYDGSGNTLFATVYGGTISDIPGEGFLINGVLAISGTTSSTDFPTTDGSTAKGNLDGTLTYIDANNGNIIFNTIYGTNSFDNPREGTIVADANAVYILARTNAVDFPTTDGSTLTGFYDIFVRKYDISGNLIYSTLIGGNSFEEVYNAKVVNGELYFIGDSQSADFPVVNGLGSSGSSDVYVVKMDPNGNIIYSTFYGGAGSDSTPSLFVNNAGEAYFTAKTDNPITTDGTNTNGNGTAFVKLNADGSLCAASFVPNGLDIIYSTELEVINDTIWTLGIMVDQSITTDGTSYSDNSDLVLTKFVFCPAPSAITSDNLTPTQFNVCQNGLIDQIIGEEMIIDGSLFPQIYINGVPENQADIPLVYQWQTSASATGPWTDIPGGLAQQNNYTPSPTTIDTYFRRLTKTSECCGGTVISTSTTVPVIVSGDVAPSGDAGGTFYSCPGDPVTIGGTPSAIGGTAPYTFDWNDGEFSGANPTVSPTESTIYTMEVTDVNGCLQVDQATVVVYQANAGEDTDVCDGAGTNIGGAALQGVTVVPGGGTPPAGEFSINYAWTPANSTLSCTDCPNPLATPSSITNYTLTTTIYRPDGSSCSSSDIVTVNVITAPSDIAIPDIVLCLGEETELGTLPPAINSPTLSSIDQSSVDAGLASIANLSDGDFSTGGHTNDGNGENITIDLGSLQLVSKLQIAALSGQTTDDQLKVEISTNNSTFTQVDFQFNGVIATTLTDIEFPAQQIRYIRLSSANNFRDVSISEFYAVYDYSYVWTPGTYITTNGKSAWFDAGNVDMPDPNPIIYTVSATLGTCNFYDQVQVAVIEAKAGEDGCGPRYLGGGDRTSNINETYSWIKIPSMSTGTGDIIGDTDILNPVSSAAVGGDVAYELTVSYTLNGYTGICKDTVIVTPCGGGAGCGIQVSGGGCPDFDEGDIGLIPVPMVGGIDDWTYSWTSDMGMVGLDSYTNAVVNLTDNVTRTYTVTMTSLLDPSTSCTASLEVNSPAFSTPAFNSIDETTCAGVPINIGDPGNNPGLSYSWTKAQFLDDGTISYPEATITETTRFAVVVTDDVTGCQAFDTLYVTVPDIAKAGPDLGVCDNGIVQIGANDVMPGYTYSWSPVAADWRNGSGPTDAKPEVFVATPTLFTLTVTDPTGTCVSTDDMMVNIESLPAPFTLPDLSFCPSNTDNLYLGYDDGTTGGTNLIPNGYDYKWSPTSLLLDPSAQNARLRNPKPSSTITFEVEVRTPAGCNIKSTQTIIPTVVQPITVSGGNVCLGAPIAIGDDSNPTGPNTSYSWSPSTDLDNPTSPNPTFTPSSTGDFTFTVTMTDNSSTPACESTNEVTLNVIEAIAPSLLPKVICEGGTVQIGITNDPSLTYEWSPTTDLDDPYIANPIFSGTTSTNYSLTVINSSGCTAETSTSVTVNPSPSIDISLSDENICTSDIGNITFSPTVNPSGSYAYSWSPSANLSNPYALNPTFYIPGQGDYAYYLDVIDQTTGCSIRDTMNVSVLYFLPEAVVISSVDSICAGQNFNLSVATNGSGLNYQWQMSTTDCSTGFTDIAGVNSAILDTSITQETFFRVVVYDNNYNCVDTSTCVSVQVLESSEVYEICKEGGHTATLTADASLTGVIWYNNANVQIGTGSSIVIDINTAGMEDFTEAFHYEATNGDGCSVGICCPIVINAIDCCKEEICLPMNIVVNRGRSN